MTDAFFVKFDASGNELRNVHFGSDRPAYDLGEGAATDGMGSAYVAESTGGALPGDQSAGGNDAFLVKFDANGNRLWTRQFGTAQDDYAYHVATGGADGIYLVGATSGAFAGNKNAGLRDAFVARFPAAP